MGLGLIYRSVKGSALTSTEVDANFQKIQDAIGNDPNLANTLIALIGLIAGDEFSITKKSPDGHYWKFTVDDTGQWQSEDLGL